MSSQVLSNNALIVHGDDSDDLGSLNEQFNAIKLPPNTTIDLVSPDIVKDACQQRNIAQCLFLMKCIAVASHLQMNQRALRARRVKRSRLPASILDKQEARQCDFNKWRESSAAQRTDMTLGLNKRRIARAERQRRIDSSVNKPRKRKQRDDEPPQQDDVIDMSHPSPVKRPTIKRAAFAFQSEEEKFVAPCEDLEQLLAEQEAIRISGGRSVSNAALQSRSYYLHNAEFNIAVMDEQILAWQNELREINDAKVLDDMYCSLRAIVMAHERVYRKSCKDVDDEEKHADSDSESEFL